MKALVTGSNGFVGSHLVDALLAGDSDVTCLVRETSDLRWLQGLDVKLIYGDVTDPDSLPDAVTGQEVVFHLGGMLRGIDYAAYHRVNTEGTANLSSACTRTRGEPPRFVFCSSLAAAGPSEGPEAQTEASKANPVTDYGRSKLAAENALRDMGVHTLPVVVFRPPAIYGPRETDIYRYFRFIRKHLSPIIGDPKKRFDMLYIEDFIDALLRGATLPQAIGRTYFLNDGRSYTWDDVARAIADALGVRALRLPVPTRLLSVLARVSAWQASMRGTVPLLHRQKAAELRQGFWTADSSRAHEELGFVPRYDLTRGIDATAQWYQDNGWL